MQQQFMKRALELAQQGSGFTSPNPMVGAVLVKNGRIIGEGFHARYGQEHAEAMAIANATESVAGADLYCTLEPCTPTIPNKKTPACSMRVIEAGLRRVYLATLDPNPYVSGSGVAALQLAGITVETGFLADEAIALNEAYFKFIQRRRSFVHLKIASSADGRIATATGDSRWITDEAARLLVHRWRARYDAVLVGVETVIADNPELTVRHCSGRQPLRLVLDSRLRIPLDSKLLRDEHAANTIIFCGKSGPAEKLERLREMGIQVEAVAADRSGQVAIPALLERLAAIPVSSVLVEGGSAVFTSFLASHCFDKLSIFYAPVVIGNGKNAIGDLGIREIRDALRLERVSFRDIGGQMMMEGYRDYREIAGFTQEEKTCLPELSRR